ncbi:MAG: hypothetical protein JWQ49_4300 [Edaphobacter sp.]|nr:hypothetical protein [Edaphobacter sp.]
MTAQPAGDSPKKLFFRMEREGLMRARQLTVSINAGRGRRGVSSHAPQATYLIIPGNEFLLTSAYVGLEYTQTLRQIRGEIMSE